ncbi:MAG TPA: hypothetical protein VGG75_14885 [Trebonia sp.]|jgi:hypothetical protein
MGILHELGNRGVLGFVQDDVTAGVDPETGPYRVDLGDSTQIEFTRDDRGGWNWARGGGYHATPISGHVQADADIADLTVEMLGPRLSIIQAGADTGADTERRAELRTYTDPDLSPDAVSWTPEPEVQAAGLAAEPEIEA